MLRSNARRGAVSAVAVAGAIALGLGIATPASATVDATTGAVTVDLLSITDFHGALLRAPNMAQQIAEIRAANEDTVFSSAGDSIGGSTFESAIFQDDPTIGALNQMGLQVSAVGNHELDQGFAALVDRYDADSTMRPAFPYLAANIEGQSDLAPSTVITTENGVRIAYIGTVTQQTPDIVSAAGVAGLTFTDPVAVTNRLADEFVRTDTADVVVALAHEASGVVASGFNGNVDVAFTGHSHETNVSTTANGVTVVQSSSSGTLLGRVQLSVPTTGPAVVLDARNLSVGAISQAQADGEGAVTQPATDAAMLEYVRAAFDRARPIGEEPVGTGMTEPFLAPSVDGRPNASTPQHRGAESPLSNMIADVARVTAIDEGIEADFGIINPGGIRADLVPSASGVVTLRQAFNVTSFSNLIGTLDLTGAQVVTLLEQQFVGQGSRPVLALGLSHLGYLYDPTAPIGSRIVDAWIEDDEGVRTPLVADERYTVASNVFLLEGQDGFTVLREGVNPQALESGIIDWEATAAYLDERDGLLPDYRQRSFGAHAVTDLDQVFEPGDEITIAFSSLSFTSTEPKPTTLATFVSAPLEQLPTGDVASAAAGQAFDVAAAEPGTLLDEAEIDNAITCTGPCQPVNGAIPGNDNETGRATATFTIPEDTEDGIFTAVFISSGEGVPSQLVAALEVEVAAAVPPVSPSPSAPAPTASAPTTPSAPPAAGGAGGSLPQTGAELAGPALALAALALLVGSGLLLRRRQRA